jgi:hypothetical protein
VVGWDVSCDARLFAREYPELPVITAGAGALEYAHADDERITVDEVARSRRVLGLFHTAPDGSGVNPGLVALMGRGTMKKLRLGIIGTGSVGARNLPPSVFSQ